MVENLLNVKSEKKEADLQQKPDDLSSYMILERMLNMLCSDECKNSSLPQECLEQCSRKLLFYSLKLSKPHSQISEKLAASAKSLLDESIKLSSIVDEIHNQDLMYF